MKKEKRTTLLILLLLGLSLLLIACGDEETDDAKDSDGDSDNQAEGWLERVETPPDDFVPEDIEGVLDDIVDALNETEQQSDMKLAVVPKDLDDYFQIAALGANRAISELGVIGSVTAPNEQSTDPEVTGQAQNDIIAPFIEDEYDGLAVAPFNSYVLESIDGAADIGAAVVTFDSDLADSKRQFYLGTDNTAAGTTAGQSLLDLLGDSVGTVVILGNTDEAWVDGYNRTMAANDVIEAAGNTVVIRHTDWTDQTLNTAFMIDALENADPAPVGMLGVFSNSYLCAEAAETAGVIDAVKIAAFDFEADTLEYMQDGKIQVTHAQRQYYMGYLAPYIMYATNVLGLEETKDLLADISVGDGLINTGLDVIAADQIDAYNDYLDGLGILN